MDKDWRQQFGDTIALRVTPKASANRIVPEKLEDGSLRLRVYVTTVPENGKANSAVIKLLSKELRVAKSSLTIVQGMKGKDKLLKIER